MRADDRRKPDQHERGGQKEKPEPAERKRALRIAGEFLVPFQAGILHAVGAFPASVPASAPFPARLFHHLIVPLNAAMTAAPIRSAARMTVTMTGKNTPQPMRQSWPNVTDPQSIPSNEELFCAGIGMF